jgi:REP element-mobilizing transposase RayT
MDPDFSRTFFVTSVTWRRRRLFQTDVNAEFLLRILFDYRDQRRFLLHEFVVMPDHFHLILTPAPTVSLEKAMQFIKGGFSYSFKKETCAAGIGRLTGLLPVFFRSPGKSTRRRPPAAKARRLTSRIGTA